MSESFTKLYALLARNDIPEDARGIIQTSLTQRPLETDVWIYRAVVCVLGSISLITVIGGIALTIISKGDAKMAMPEAIVAIGSAAIGALAGLLAPSPAR